MDGINLLVIKNSGIPVTVGTYLRSGMRNGAPVFSGSYGLMIFKEIINGEAGWIIGDMSTGYYACQSDVNFPPQIGWKCIQAGVAPPPIVEYIDDKVLLNLLPTTKIATDLQSSHYWMDHLFSACRGNRLGLVKEIIEHGCPIDLTESDSGDTPLLIACEKGFTQLLEYCLQQKAAIDPHPDFGYTGFQLAVMNGHYDCCSILLEKAQQRNELKLLLSNADLEGDLPIHLCAGRGHLDILRLLLQYDAVLTESNKEKKTVLHFAASQGRVEMTQFILQNVNYEFINQQDIDGNTALHVAAMNDRDSIVRLLIEYKADPNIRNNNGERPYDIAVAGKSQEAIRVLEPFNTKKNFTYRDGTFERGLFRGMKIAVPDIIEGEDADRTRDWAFFQYALRPRAPELFAVEDKNTHRYVVYRTITPETDDPPYYLNEETNDTTYDDPRSNHDWFKAPPHSYDEDDKKDLELEALIAENDRLFKKLMDLSRKYDRETKNKRGIHELELNQKDETIEQFKQEIDDLSSLGGEDRVKRLLAAIENLQKIVDQLLAEYNEKMAKWNELNNKFDNLIGLEMNRAVMDNLDWRKGNRKHKKRENILVFCRVRPLLPYEVAKGESQYTTEFPFEDVIVLNKSGYAYTFNFDQVFPPIDSQERVFQEVEPFITKALDGFNLCIFAYGQTGAGKTHTMMGPEEDPGLMFRTLNTLFYLMQVRKNECRYNCSLSIIEVYNEMVTDLLNADKKAGYNLELRLGKDGKVYTDGLLRLDVSTYSEVIDYFAKASENRAIGKHNMNEHSSRSHLIITINLAGINLKTGESKFSRLHLIDLAGSERVYKTAADGARLNEAKSINKSLSALGGVINAFAMKSKHVPYRDSKLTYYLQESLSGDSKLLMFVNISPAKWNLSESIASLQFAARCRSLNDGA